MSQGNDYLVTVKGNQPKLVEQFQQAIEQAAPVSESTTVDLTHGRAVQRQVQVFAAPKALAQTWAQAQSLVVVYRTGMRDQQSFSTTSYYLSSLTTEAVTFGLGIRQHRDIENGLHWVKDVVLGEDAAPFADFTPALNWAVLRTIALNLFRSNGYPSLTRGIRLLQHDLAKLLSLLRMN